VIASGSDKRTQKWLIFKILLLSFGCNKAEVKDRGQFSEAVAPKILGVCTECHANGKAEKGFGYVDDVEKMIEKGKIDPGNAAGSRIAQKISENWGGGRRMPLRGPYFSAEDQAKVNIWINEDLYVAKAGVEWSVDIVTGSGVTSDKVGPQTVADGAKLSLRLTLNPVGSEAEIGGTCPSGSLTPGADGTYSYETGVIRADCSIAIKRTVPGGGGEGGGGEGGGGEGHGIDPEEFAVTFSSAYGTESGGVPNISTTVSSKFVTAGEAATFEFTLRENDDLSLDTAVSIGGTCPKGSLTLTNPGTRTYSYSTGNITGACSILVKSSNPCQKIVPSVTFTDVNQILINGTTEGCTSCHYTGSTNLEDAFADFGNGQNGLLVHTKLTTNTASNNMKLIEAGKPLQSAIYLQIDPVLNYRNRMPFEATEYIQLEDRSKICNWIYDGADDN
jgi:hypothetical protein